MVNLPNLFRLLDEDLRIGLSSMSILFKDTIYVGECKDLNLAFIRNSYSIGDIRDKAKCLLDLAFPDDAAQKDTAQKDAAVWHKILLGADFTPQKEELKRKPTSKFNLIVLQGTPLCGLSYFIKYKHCHPCTQIHIKAENVALNQKQKEIEIWEQIVNILGLELNVSTTKKDIPTAIGMGLEQQLKEKPVVIIIYAIDSWGNSYWNNITTLAKYLKRILIENSENPFYCYFVCTNDAELSNKEEADLIILPPVECMAKYELFNLLENAKNDRLFLNCDIEIDKLFEGEKRLSEIIHIFLEHSSCKDELRQYLSKVPPFFD